MTKWPKPQQSGNAGTGVKVGDAAYTEQGRDGGGTGERGGTREENTFDNPRLKPKETNPPRRRSGT
ncbi:MAG TPA: hypothetical protein VFK86_08005 [Bauldia sp.]|nr:hypothetical protein [Bauldia sp.]